MNADREPCPSCGARLGGRAGCQAVFDVLTAMSWTNPVRGRVHKMVVDAYAMQHPEEYGRSAKSYIRHLSALGCLIEHPGDHRLYWATPSESGPPIPPKPALLSKRGEITIADVREVADDELFQRAVEHWAASVWAAYAPQHDLAKGFLAALRRVSKL
ncbi:MAG TPA: DUF5946 family protein [Vicinamibacterales bacterium]|nr:DUF5946 family protein [Vicinamibacterales bacterium]